MHMLTATATNYAKDIHGVLAGKSGPTNYFEFTGKDQLVNGHTRAQQQQLVSKPGDQRALEIEFEECVRKEI